MRIKLLFYLPHFDIKTDGFIYKKMKLKKNATRFALVVINLKVEKIMKIREVYDL
jgi:hypothetical protein